MRMLRGLLVSGSLLAASSLAAAGQTGPSAARSAALTQTLPVDPAVATGRFDNGLRYYIRVNKEPQNRAELRLVVNAGSLLEDDDQLGLAHFVEHMAFNGTKNFPKQDIVTFMESIGMRFGPSVNAFTSFDETVYMLQVPTDKPDVLARAFLVLEDWAHNVSFDPAEIDKERGVIIEEWRLRRGAAARMLDQQFPVLLKGSRYADRLPIGKTEIIEGFAHERLKKFYSDWYRPDLMAVIVVGDIDAAAVRGLLEKHFGSIPKPAVPRLRPTYPVPPQPGTLYAIATDPEATTASVEVYSKMAVRDPSTVGAYRRQLVEILFGSLLSTRFAELAQKPNPPFLGASAGRGLFVRSAEASILSALVKEDGIDRGLDAVFTEAERVARFGFTASELDREKLRMMRSLDQALAEKDKRRSSTLAAEYVRAFTQREPIPGLEYEHELTKRFLPEITLDEINRLAKEWVPDGNRVVLVSAPRKPALTVPDGTRLAAVIAGVAGSKLEPYVDAAAARALLEPIPEPGKITGTATRDAIGITEWELSNGVTVVLKPTTFKEDEVIFRAFSPGGTSLVSDAEFVPALTASQVIAGGGLGSFNSIELQKVLAGKVASARAFIGELEEGLSGSASRKDLETMFQLIHLSFTQPRADQTFFGVMTEQMKAFLANQTASPEFAFSEAQSAALSQNHPRARPMTVETVGQMSLDRSFAFYKDRFADASDFTFVFVGSFDLDAMRPLVERYLASLPSLRRKETWKDVGMHPPKGIVEKRVEKGIEPKSQTGIVFTGPFEYDQTQRVAINALALVLQTRLREALREELGGTYSVGVNAGYSKIPRREYSLSIGFGSAPDRTESLIKRVFEEIAALKADGPSETQVNDARETFLREFETNLKQNRYLLTQIYLKYQYGEAPETLLGVPEYYRKLTRQAIQEAARAYLTDNYVKVSLFPEKKTEAAQPTRRTAGGR
jgi:zinc protease